MHVTPRTTPASHQLLVGVTQGFFNNKTSKQGLMVPLVVFVSPKLLDRNEFARGPQLSVGPYGQAHRRILGVEIELY